MTEHDNATVNLREGKQEKFKTTIIDANNDDSTLRVLVTGASGFIGSRLVSRLTSSSIISSISNPIFCLPINITMEEIISLLLNEEDK